MPSAAAHWSRSPLVERIASHSQEKALPPPSRNLPHRSASPQEARLPSPPLQTGQFTLAAFVYLEPGARHGTVATNIRSNDGNFALGLDENGVLQGTIRDRDGDLLSVSGDAAVALHTWRHVVMTVDGQQFRLYEDGHLVASAACSPVADGVADVLWFGTNADGQKLWNGRIDEVALFDRAFSDVDVTDLYEAAIEEIKRLE